MLRPVAFALGATLVLAGCGGGGGAPAGADAGTVDAGPTREANCGDLVDEDADGKTDCDDPDCSGFLECKPVEPGACAKQRDCGNIVDETFTNLCLGGKCVPPGPKTIKNEPVTSQAFFDLTLKAPLTNVPRPQTVVVRFVYPEKLDRTPLSCTDVIGKLSDGTKNCVDQTTRTVLDGNPAINQVFRVLYPLTWNCTGTICQFPNLIATVPQGQNFILYGEAWYGERNLNYPTGQCASLFCIEGKSVAGDGQHFVLTFPDPNHPN
ncbi:MAG TPA: hypothetical protein VGK67_31355 [Myxococcales bacterium]|jgi:hypothetical protein